MHMDDTTNWINCDSRSDMESRLASIKGNVFETAMASDSSTWGYIAAENNIFIPIGFADVGLPPQFYIHKNTVLVGVSDTLLGYNLSTGKLIFSYKMPTVFHEFVLFLDDNFIVQDEIGFVSLFFAGNEKWVQLCDDMIETYEVNNSSITGKTVEGSSFHFNID